MGSKSGNSVDDNTSTSETTLSKREYEGVKGVCCILLILFRAPCDGDLCVLARGTESSGRREWSAEEAAAVAVSPCLSPGCYWN
ncbi:hypothetical protein NDU88_001626 [Pleurodeles waltl]|uniref:Uncharacterized protein n=1 Tax=Pleurodeles waltl TaxID=8319 RepID=A0AAV7V8B5_PLEWA|nr:hypothetical protein NDU88_001626 [Pleurodeles waltl]